MPNQLARFPNFLSLTRSVIAFVLCTFTIYTAFVGVFPDMLQRAFHLSLVILLIFLSGARSAISHDAQPRLRLRDLFIAVVGFAVLIYHVIFFEQISQRWGNLTETELWLGVICVLVLLEATRRSIGWSIVILALVFLGYAFSGPHLPGILYHRGYSLERVISHLYLGGSGIFGTPLGVSSTFVMMIVIFGAFLERSGAGKVLMDIATGATGRTRGGPAKAAVVGSSLMGMISGTAVANVLTTGTISIPLMKRNGYRPHVAGAIEAVASTGGQLMPPVMGAAAFIMADIIERPYVDIAAAAIIPAFLYYLVLFLVVHFEALKNNIPVLSAQELPGVSDSLWRGGYLLLPLIVFGWLLIMGYSVMFTSFWAVVAVLLMSYIKPKRGFTLKDIALTFMDAANAALPVAIACAAAGIIIGIITLTGLGLKFSSLIIAVAGSNLLLALFLTLIASLVLGMGLPTAAAYILVSTLVAPALVELGVDLLAAHLFCFYGAMLSAITPPVAMAAYAAASIANANPFRIAVTACGFGAAAFVVPFCFVINPALIGLGTIQNVLISVLTAVVGCTAIASAVQGWFLCRMSIIERVGAFLGGLLLTSPEFFTDLIGAIFITLAVIRQLLVQKGEQPNQRRSNLTK